MLTDAYDIDENSRCRAFCVVLVGRSVVGDDDLLGSERLRPPARTPLLEAYVADIKSVSYMDRE